MGTRDVIPLPEQSRATKSNRQSDKTRSTSQRRGRMRMTPLRPVKIRSGVAIEVFKGAAAADG